MTYESENAAMPTSTNGENAVSGIDGFPDRLASVVGDQSVRSFARRCGFSEGVLRSYLKGKTFPTLDKLHAIAEQAGVVLGWLATGEGPMKLDEWEKEKELGALDQIKIPQYDLAASAGTGRSVPDEGLVAHLVFSKRWLDHHVGVPINCLSAIEASGDSMAPEIDDGDTLLVDNSETSVSTDGIYVIRLDDELLVKRLQRLVDGGLAIKSTNDHYDDYTLSQDQARGLRIVGRVRWHGRKM